MFCSAEIPPNSLRQGLWCVAKILIVRGKINFEAMFASAAYVALPSRSASLRRSQIALFRACIARDKARQTMGLEHFPKSGHRFSAENATT